MMRKLISWLAFMMAFCLVLLSCVHDEIYTPSDPASKEYHSKSLWKEDEKYIKNVMKVYSEHHEEIKKGAGEPMWDYAMTMDRFDESFLMVPVAEQGKVIAVLNVPRKGQRVYFTYTQVQNDMEFFQNLMSSRPKRAETTLVDNTAGKLVCTTKTISMFYPDNESDPDGPGHWESHHVTECKSQQLESCVGEVLPDGTCLGGGGNDPGYPYPGGGDEDPQPEPEDPCAKAVNNNTNAKALLNNTKIALAQTQLTSTLGTDTNEKSFSFGKDANGNYETTPIKTATAGNQVGLQANNPNLSIEGGAHTHTTDLFNCFSAGDIYSLQGANTINPSFNIFFVFANGGIVYALTITDPIKYADFVANHSAGNNLDMTTSHWKESSPIFVSFENALTQFQRQGFSEDDAMANATALILSKYDVGASLSQKDSSGNFKSIFVNENITNINVGGIYIPIYVYNQTTDCNLKP